jgi:hypothetical protein
MSHRFATGVAGNLMLMVMCFCRFSVSKTLWASMDSNSQPELSHDSFLKALHQTHCGHLRVCKHGSSSNTGVQDCSILIVWSILRYDILQSINCILCTPVTCYYV